MQLSLFLFFLFLGDKNHTYLLLRFRSGGESSACWYFGAVPIWQICSLLHAWSHPPYSFISDHSSCALLHMHMQMHRQSSLPRIIFAWTVLVHILFYIILVDIYRLLSTTVSVHSMHGLEILPRLSLAGVYVLVRHDNNTTSHRNASFALP